ncbi:MAG: hypothetical protein PVF58_06810 [Candidatus Methanofastidiosia archaeon]|jgi:hypothetical protein
MKKVLILVAVLCLSVPGLCLADEMADAEAAIKEVEDLLEEMDSWGVWYGPSLAMKMEAEEHLKMAQEAFEAGDYAEAKKHADIALQTARQAIGLRLWYLLTRSGIYGYTSPPPQ